MNAWYDPTSTRTNDHLSLVYRLSRCTPPVRNALSLQRSVTEHRALYDALVAGDGRQAWSVLQQHVEVNRDRLNALLNDEPERWQ